MATTIKPFVPSCYKERKEEKLKREHFVPSWNMFLRNTWHNLQSIIFVQISHLYCVPRHMFEQGSDCD